MPELVSDSDVDIIQTDIEELRDAAKSIQSLKRVLKIPSEIATKGISNNIPGTGSIRCSGIASRIGGHPRGVIQFLPSVKQRQILPALDTYRWNKNNNDLVIAKKNIFRRKTSLPETYLTFSQVHNADDLINRTGSARTSRRQLRNDDDKDLFTVNNPELLQSKGVNSLAGFNRFSKLLDSLRSNDQNSSENQFSRSWKPSEPIELHQSLLQADLLLWRKRSRASLRRHNDIRNMAIREFHDTEKNFVESLEYLVQKYMRPLRQPLECILIDGALADKIFYMVPEILIHHQHFLAALNDRLEKFQSDTCFGDILLAHFRKQSMIETYMAFVDNFTLAKQAIIQARTKPSFEKYYMRCCRDHKNKIDLDSLLISPIQRIPRYELIIKQIVKHTSVEHCDYENLLLSQKHIHELAAAINRQKEDRDEREQRLREIEAIVDGLDDLVSTSRSFKRYDVVNIAGPSGWKQRCLFLMSDQVIVTSIKKKSPSGRNIRNIAQFLQSADFLEDNRFKLLVKISLDDIEIRKETLSLLRSTEVELQDTVEDESIINKMVELSKLLKTDYPDLSLLLSNIRTTTMQRNRALQEQLLSDPQLTTVEIEVTTISGVEKLTLHFPNADKRAIWENALIDAKNILRDSLEHDQTPIHLKSIITHRARSGLIFSAASPTIGRNADGAPNVWACTSDKFSGQIVIINVNGEPTIESNTSVGNATIVAICAVPAPRKKRRISAKKVDSTEVEQPGLELDSSSSDSEQDSDFEAIRKNVQSTIWIGNDDGEIFVFNFLENIRLKSRERMTRLALPVDDIVYLDEKVFVSSSSSSHTQLNYFQRAKDGIWDLENPKLVRIDLHMRLRPMIVVVSRLCVASGNSIYFINPTNTQIEKSCQLSSHAAESVGHMASLGSTIFVAMNKSAVIKVVNAFTLDIILEFTIANVVNKTLSYYEDIIRKHKMGCLRISALLSCKNRLWIGTSAGIILSTIVGNIKNNWTPSFHVCKAGHIGPCRFLTALSASSSSIMLTDMRRRRMSLNAPSLQQLDQIYIISGGEGFDNINTEISEEKTGIDDSVNHLLFWTV